MLEVGLPQLFGLQLHVSAGVIIHALQLRVQVQLGLADTVHELLVLMVLQGGDAVDKVVDALDFAVRPSRDAVLPALPLEHCHPKAELFGGQLDWHPKALHSTAQHT